MKNTEKDKKDNESKLTLNAYEKLEKEFKFDIGVIDSYNDIGIDDINLLSIRNNLNTLNFMLFDKNYYSNTNFDFAGFNLHVMGDSCYPPYHIRLTAQNAWILSQQINDNGQAIDRDCPNDKLFMLPYVKYFQDHLEAVTQELKAKREKTEKAKLLEFIEQKSK